jgi:phosphoglycerate dehydrogenase-like enzyme
MRIHKMKLLLTGAFNYSEEQIDKLKMLGYDILFVQDERIALQIDSSDVDAIVCNSLFLYNDIKKFKNLKIIQLTSSGVDRVPINYIKENGIILYNAKGVYSIPMAEWAILKILEVYKKSKQFYESQTKHKWKKQHNLLELTNKTVSIIGYGSVGSEIAKRLVPFGVKIIGVGRGKVEADFLDEYRTIEDLDEVLSISDIVILTIPHTEKTRHLINAHRIKILKDDATLINVARGGIIDEMALVNALQSGKFLGIALDVFEEEPLSQQSPLWDFERVIVSPHNSFNSDKINNRLFNLILSNLKKNSND